MAAEDKSPPLTSYPEMILAAITALDQKEGSSKTAISEYLESYHKDLPAGHATLLAHFLGKMRENGELEFVDNNYKKPDPSVSKKRGRGRPPKPKEPVPPGTPAVSPRPRGRPPKPKDPMAVAASKASAGMPKRRGRPPKSAGEKKEKPKVAAPAAPKPAGVAGVKRGRGRPPKVKPEAAAVSSG